jgi:hypothetical protein
LQLALTVLESAPPGSGVFVDVLVGVRVGVFVVVFVAVGVTVAVAVGTPVPTLMQYSDRATEQVENVAFLTQVASEAFA